MRDLVRSRTATQLRSESLPRANSIAYSRHRSTTRPSCSKSGVVELELVTSQAAEPPKHLRENIRRESAILLGGKRAEMPQSVAWLDGHQICEVPRLGATEDGKHLVDGQLLTTQRRCRLSRLGRKEPRVGTQINLRAFAVALNDESGETRGAL